MVETADDNTTSANWPLAGDELAFVTKIVGSETLAKDLLLDDLDADFIRWRCQELAIEDPADFSANLPLWTSIAAARRFFWHRATHSRIDMDWTNHRATRVGPVMQLRSQSRAASDAAWPITTKSEEEEEAAWTWPFFDLRGSTTVTAKLVRFHHGDVVNMLVRLGLMPRPAPISDSLATIEASDSVAVSGVTPESPKAVAETASPSAAPESVTAPKTPTASEPSIATESSTHVLDSAKQFIAHHPRGAEEEPELYFDRLHELCGEKWSRKTLQNYYYKLHSKPRI
jgi:hypothetical protein